MEPLIIVQAILSPSSENRSQTPLQLSSLFFLCILVFVEVKIRPFAIRRYRPRLRLVSVALSLVLGKFDQKYLVALDAEKFLQKFSDQDVWVIGRVTDLGGPLQVLTGDPQRLQLAADREGEKR